MRSADAVGIPAAATAGECFPASISCCLAACASDSATASCNPGGQRELVSRTEGKRETATRWNRT